MQYMTLFPMPILIDVSLKAIPTGDHHIPTETLQKFERCRLSSRPFRMLHGQVILDTSRGSQPLIANRAAVLQIFAYMCIM